MVKTVSRRAHPASTALLRETLYQGSAHREEASLPSRDSFIQTNHNGAIQVCTGSTEEGEVNQSGRRWEGFCREVMSSWTWKNESLNQVIKVRGEVQQPKDKLTFPGRISFV